MADDAIRRTSCDELAAMQARGDYAPTRHDAPVHKVDEAFWREARVVHPVRKVRTGLMIDADVPEPPAG